MSEVKLVPSNELLGAMLSAAGVSAQELQADAKSYIYARYNYDLGNKSVAIAENDSSVVHVALPYYSNIETAKAEAMSGDDLDAVSGGEIWITFAVFGGLSHRIADSTGRDQQEVLGDLLANPTKYSK